MDLEDIVKNVDTNINESENTAGNTEVTVENSDSTKTEETPAPETATSAVTEESNSNSNVEKEGTERTASDASETPVSQTRKVVNKSSYSPLARAQHSAAKWQRKYKSLEKQLAETQAELKKYNDIDIDRFDNDEDRQSYLAWKASKNQRMDDLTDEMDRVRESALNERAQYDAEIFDEKVDNIYGNHADEFRALENEWGDIYEVACNKFDRHNVVRDFVKNSPLGPAIKNVIYGDAELQDELFTKTSGNPMIDASNRLALLRKVENTITNYLNQRHETNSQVPEQKTSTVQYKTRKLPHLPPKKQSEQVTGPQVTGPLTRTDKSGVPDAVSEVADVYRSIFG